ncbi:MAG: RNA chaperone Hfq [Terriglobales bacterium]|jgi:sRNA-binding regulator protein Hfq
MKDGNEATAVGRAPAPDYDGFTSRKLIRPTLNHRAELRGDIVPERRERPERQERPAAGTGKKTPPPEQTHAENFYYQKQMQTKTPMVVVLQNGEELHGQIEWYDRSCIKLVRAGAANVLVYKPAIKYMFKESEGR